MKECYFFYRSEQHCLLAKNERSDEWHGFVGMNDKHPYHGCGFKKIKNISIGKVPINNSIDTMSSVRKNLWYMGFCTHPFSREKTLEDLKKLADDISEDVKKDD
jgi:hypothetical protein